MKIYHGSIEQICSPEIREPNRRLDYGAVFMRPLHTNKRNDGFNVK